jgi:hypothetical protein
VDLDYSYRTTPQKGFKCIPFFAVHNYELGSKYDIVKLGIIPNNECFGSRMSNY